jgi:multiple sugar transport system permease protein
MESIGKILKKHIISQAALLFFAVLFIMPLIWQLSTSLKFPEDVFKMEWIPSRIRWDNYIDVIFRMPFGTYTKNSLILSVIPAIFMVISSSLIAYSFTKIPWKGAKIFFPIMMATIMLPYQVTMIPIYGIWAKLGLIDTFWPLILPNLFGSAYNVFLLRQFFINIPDSYIDSARIDGAGEGTILFKLIMPLSKPILITIALFTFIGGWNDFQGPLIYLNSMDKYTLAIGLQTFLVEHATEWELLMAGSTICILPMIIIFFLGQKQFINGIVLTGIK